MVFKKNVARICPLKLLDVSNFKEKSDQSSGIETPIGFISKINIIGMVVSVDGLSFIIDDGTSSILVRSFDSVPKVVQGDIVLVIGRLRKYNDSLYVALEILNSESLQNKVWFPVRVNEIKSILKSCKTDDKSDFKVELPVKIIQPQVKKENSNEITPTKSEEDLLDFIRDNDSGEGCSKNLIFQKFGNIDDQIMTYLNMGDIYEIKPGFLKLLE